MTNKAVRFVTTTKKSDRRASDSKELSIVIPTAGSGHRMKSYGPKSLLKLKNGESLLSYQINTIKKVYPNADIIVVVGFEADRIADKFKQIRLIENERYEDTNVVHSIALGLRASVSSKTLIIYGNTFFNSKSVTLSNLNESCLFTTKVKKNSDIGAIVHNSFIVNLAYDLEYRWNKAIFVQGKELDLMHKIIHDPNKEKFLGHEILNHMIEIGGQFKNIDVNDSDMLEIHSHKELHGLGT